MADPFSPAIPSVLAEAAHAAALAEAHLMPAARPVHDAPKELAEIVAKLPSETDGRVVNQLLLQLIEIAKTTHSVRKITPLKPLLVPMRRIAADGERALRAQAFRAIRYLLTDKACLKEFFELNLDVFTARALDRDGKYVWERTQALKIVKTIIAIDPSMMTRTLVQSIVAIAETPKDDFRHVCLDTLRELALVNAPIVASCNGLRCIVSAILNSETQDAAGSMTLTLLFLLDQDSTRKYMRAELEIERLFSVFTDFTAPNDRAKETKRAAAHKALVTIMRSWTGILCLASDRGGLRALIQILSLPTGVKGASWAKEAIFDLLFEILHVVQSQDLALAIEKDMWSRMGPNLLHNYMVMVLLALIDCGLVDALTDLTLSHDFEFSSVAQKLLMEVLRLSAEFFPREFCANLNALPGVVRYAAAFSFEAAKRFRAANVLTDLRDLNLAFRDTLQSTLLPAFAPVKPVAVKSPAPSGSSPAPASSAVTEHPRLRKLHQQAEERRETGRRVNEVHGLDLELLATQTDATHSFSQVPFAAVMETAYASSVGPRTPTALASASFAQSYKQLSSPSDRLLGELRLQIESSMDDLELHALMKKSQVVNTKEYRDWDWNVIIEILTGPLWSAHCLSVALSTKFCKRLLSFLRPEKAFFSALPWTLENMKYVRAACQLFRVLITHKEGSEYVHFTQLVEEILQFFTKEMNKGKEDGKDGGGAISANPALRPFSRDSTTKQLSREYFTLLGILSSSDVGLNLLDNSHLYETMYKAYEDESRDYLTRLLLANLDYGANKKARTLLEFLVKNGSMSIRKWAISHLRLLLRRNVADFWQWGVGLLLLQLQGKDIETALAALSVLEEACQANPECLVTVVKKKPVLRLIGERANNLRTTLLSTPSGVEYLSRTKCIEPLMNCWAKNGGNQKYIECLEAALVTALNTGTGFGIQNEGGENAPSSSNSPQPAAPAPSPTPAPRIVMPLASSAPGLGNLLSSPAPSLASPEQELDESIISGPGFVGAFGGFGGFRGTHASCRSPADDYLFDRIHHLPWTVSLTLEIGSRSHILNTDTFVHTVPQAGDEDGLQTFVVANLIETDGKVGPFKVDPPHTLRARLNISDLPMDSKKKPKDSVCTPEHRAALAEAAMGPNGTQSITVDLVRWNFQNPAVMGRMAAEPSNPTHQRTPSRLRAQTRPETGNDKSLLLESVWFQIPTVTNSMPVVSLAPHLFGELAKTEDGVRVLRDSHHLRDMVQVVKSIRSSSAESTEPSTSTTSATDQRAALWALGHIGSSPLGFKLLLETGVVQLISQQAISCPVLSMRGTCFYVLGLMTRTEGARRVLRDLGWQFSPQPDSGIIVPQSFKEFINIGSTPFVGSWATDEANKFGIDYVPLKMQAEDDPDAETNVPNNPARIILGHISNLCNNVSQKNSLNALRSFKATYPQYFASPILFAEAMKLMTAYNFKLPARRFILFDLFNQVDFSTGAVFDRPQDHTDEEALNTFNGLPFVVA